jgi:hypothetical protein
MGRVLIEQYRIPTGKGVIELPDGLARDKPGHANELPMDAARRELNGGDRLRGRPPEQGGFRRFLGGVGEKVDCHPRVPHREVGAGFARQVSSSKVVDLKV